MRKASCGRRRTSSTSWTRGTRASRHYRALDGWGATSSEKVLDALETRAATPIPLAAFVFALGAPRIGKATAKRVAGICGSWAALRRCLAPTTAADDALRTALAEARGVGPAAVEGLLEFFSGEADAAVADRLAARLDVVDDDTYYCDSGCGTRPYTRAGTILRVTPREGRTFHDLRDDVATEDFPARRSLVQRDLKVALLRRTPPKVCSIGRCARARMGREMTGGVHGL